MNSSKTEAELVREAVSDIPREIMALGGTLAQGKPLRRSTRLVLMGENAAKVRQALERGNYPQYAINDLIDLIRKISTWRMAIASRLPRRPSKHSYDN